MSTIVTRSGKGSPLTHTEVDDNFTNLNTDKYQSGDAVSFTTLTATGQTSLGGAAGSESLRVLTPSATGAWADIQSFSGSSQISANAGSGNIDLIFNSRASGSIRFRTAGGTEQARVSHTASAVNYVQVTGAATGSGVVISSQGSDTSPPMLYSAKGFSSHRFYTNGGTTDEQFRIYNTTTSRNYFQVTGAVTGNSPKFEVAGSDTNISQVFQSKGTGAIDLAAGSSGVNISNGGTVTAITRTAAGSAYTSLPSVAITAPTTAGGVQATATATMELAAVTQTVVSGGTGYTVNDTLVISGGTFGTAAQFVVSAVSGGVITAVVRGSIGVGYTALPSNPVSVTGGTGSGATFNASWAITNVFTITNAGSGYVEQPTVSFSGGGGSGAAAYATVGSQPTLKGLNTFNFATNSGTHLQLLDGGLTNTNFLRLQGGSTVYAGSAGSDTNVGLILYSRGTGNVDLATNSGTTQMRVSHTASAVNYVQVTGAATGAYPIISGQGSDTNVGLLFRTKGSPTGPGIRFENGSGAILAAITASTASPANYVRLDNAATGSPSGVSSQGSDTNIDLTLTPKGSGAVVVSTSLNTPNTFGFKNRLLNGGMVIDQRNAGASITPTTNGTMCLDRWKCGLNAGLAASKYSVQQSSTAPAGFNNSVLITSTSAYTVQADDYSTLSQAIEGFNFADLGWGTANAQPITISFQIRSSLTGTFAGWVQNNNADRSYPFTFTISAANTWERKTVTIAGDTSGTWIGATNSTGLLFGFNLGTGSNRQGTANTWGAGNYRTVSGAVNLIATNAATMYITGVQLEKGSTATSFDYRPYGTELALCQRYYYQIAGWYVPPGATAYVGTPHKVSMRATPTLGGGGAGFATGFNNSEAFFPYQTTGAYLTALTVSAEL
jgi:hypothetical protein